MTTTGDELGNSPPLKSNSCNAAQDSVLPDKPSAVSVPPTARYSSPRRFSVRGDSRVLVEAKSTSATENIQGYTELTRA